MAGKVPAWFWRFGLLLFITQAHIFLFGTPYFQVGFWAKQEPRLLAIFVVSAISCVWFWQGFYKRWISITKSMPSLFWLMWAWIAWQIIVTLTTATSGWRSWFGSGEFGEGAGWSLCLGLLATMAYALWPHATCRRGMVLGTVSAVILMYLMQVVTPELSRWKPIAWPDYLGFVIGWVWMIIHMCYPAMSAKRQIELAIGAMILLVLSQNKVSIALLFAAGIVCISAVEWALAKGREHLPVTKSLRLFACAVCLLGVAYTLVSIKPSTFYSGDINTSLHIRLHMNSIGLHALKEEPERLLMGRGWNRFQDENLKYAVIDNVRLFRDGELHFNSGQILGSSAHSHNQPLEALLACGIVGLVLWFALAFIVILKLPDALFWRVVPIHVAMVLTSYFWFPLPFYCAFMALFLAGVMQATAPKQMLKPSHAGKHYDIAALACIPIGFLLLWSATEQFKAMRYGDWLNQALRQPYQEYPMASLMEDAARGGERLQAVTSVMLNRAYGPQRTELPDMPLWCERLLSASYLMSTDERVGIHARTLDLIIQFFLQMKADDTRYDKARADSFLFYPASVVRVARQAPQRDDLSAPYLYQLEKRADKPTLSLILSRLLDANPDHRVALWLTGKLLAEEDETKESGIRLMKRALENGVSKIYPISEEEENRINNL